MVSWNASSENVILPFVASTLIDWPGPIIIPLRSSEVDAEIASPCIIRSEVDVLLTELTVATTFAVPIVLGASRKVSDPVHSALPGPLVT